MKPSEIAEILQTFGRLWPNQTPSPDAETVRFWTEQLGQVQKVAVLETLRRLAADNAYPPNPLFVRKETLRRDFGAPSADEAWLQVTRQIHDVGRWGEPHFEHPAVRRAVEILTWKVLCEHDDTRPYMLNDFRRVYSGLVEHALQDETVHAALAPPSPPPSALPYPGEG